MVWVLPACETEVPPPKFVLKSTKGGRVSHAASDSSWPDFPIILFFMHKASDSLYECPGSSEK